jgi:hypothetical protein
MRCSRSIVVFVAAAVRNFQMPLEAARPLTYSGVKQY